jgi:hypothetical protein
VSFPKNGQLTQQKKKFTKGACCLDLDSWI